LWAVDYILSYKGTGRPMTRLWWYRGEADLFELNSLTSALNGVGGQGHAPAALPPGQKPNTHCIGYVCLRAGLDG